MDKYRYILLIGSLLLATVFGFSTPFSIMPEVPPIFQFHDEGVVALRPLAEIIGAKITVDKGIVTAARNGKSFSCSESSKQAKQNGVPDTLPIAPFTRQGILYVPVEPLMEALGGRYALGMNQDRPRTATMSLPGVKPLTLKVYNYQSGRPDTIRINSALFIVRIDGSSQRQLSFDGNNIDQIALSSDGMMLASAPTFGTMLLRKTNDPCAVTIFSTPPSDLYGYSSLSFSPDNHRLLFSCECRITGSRRRNYVFYVNTDGSDQRYLTEGFNPRWSPDGRFIALADYDNNNQLKSYLFDVNTEQCKEVAMGCFPSFAADGKSLLIYKKYSKPHADPKDNDPYYYLNASIPLDANGAVAGPERELTPQNRLESEWNGCCHPHESSFVYANGHGIFIANLEDRTNKRLVVPAAGTFISAPVFSLDGQHIAFRRQDKSGSSIWIVNTDGSGMKRLIPNRNVESFVFTPDGKSLLYTGMMEK